MVFWILIILRGDSQTKCDVKAYVSATFLTGNSWGVRLIKLLGGSHPNSSLLFHGSCIYRGHDCVTVCLDHLEAIRETGKKLFHH